MLRDIVGQLAAPDPVARDAALRNLLFKAAYRLVPLPELAANGPFLGHALRWFESPGLTWDEPAVALLRLLTLLLEHPAARRSLLGGGALKCFLQLRASPTLPPEATPLLDQAIHQLQALTPGVPSPAGAHLQSPVPPALCVPSIPATPVTPDPLWAAASHALSPTSGISPAHIQETPTSSPIFPPSYSPASPINSPVAVEADVLACVPPSQLPFWGALLDKSLAESRAHWGGRPPAVLFDTGVRLRHSDPTVVRDALLFLLPCVSAGRAMLDAVVDSGLLLTTADLLYATAVRLRQAEAVAQGRPALFAVLHAAVQCLHAAATQLGSAEGGRPERRAAYRGTCLLLLERVVQSLQCLNGAPVAIGALLGNLLAALPPDGDSAEERTELGHATEHLLTDLLSRVTVLLHAPPGDRPPRHLLPAVAAGDAASLNPADAAPAVAFQTPAGSPAPPPGPPSAATAPGTPSSAASSSTAAGPSPAPPAAGWRHPQLAYWLQGAHRLLLLRQQMASRGGLPVDPVVALWGQLLRQALELPTSNVLRKCFPQLYRDLRVACNEAMVEALEEANAQESAVDRVGRHALYLFQLLGQATDHQEFLAALECLLAFQSLQPQALTTAFKSPGDALHNFTKYLRKPPATQMDRLVVQRLLCFCIGLLEAGVLHRADVEYLVAMTVEHLVANLLGSFRLDTAADLCRTLPLVTAFLAYCAALLPACLRAAADLELATLLGHEELWHCVALLTTAALEAAFEAGGGSGQQSHDWAQPAEYRAAWTHSVAVHALHLVAVVATLSGTAPPAGPGRAPATSRLRLALLAVGDALARFGALQVRQPPRPSLVAGTPAAAAAALGDAAPEPPDALLAHLHKALLQRVLVAAVDLTELCWRAGELWTALVALPPLAWLGTAADPTARAAYFRLLAHAVTDEEQRREVLTAVPPAPDHAVAALLAPAAPPALRAAALRLVVALLEARPAPTAAMEVPVEAGPAPSVPPSPGAPLGSELAAATPACPPAPGLSASQRCAVVDAVWVQLMPGTRGVPLPGLSLWLRAATVLLTHDTGPPGHLLPLSAVEGLVAVIEELVAEVPEVPMTEGLALLNAAEQAWALLQCLLRQPSVAPLSHCLQHTRLVSALVLSLEVAASSIPVTVDTPGRRAAAAVRQRLLPRLGRFLEAAVHDCPTNAWSGAWAAAAPGWPAEVAGRLLGVLATVVGSCGVPLDVRLLYTAIVGALLCDNQAAQEALQDGPLMPDAPPADVPAPTQPSSLAVSLFQALCALWDSLGPQAWEDHRAAAALGGALGGVLLRGEAAKRAALRAGWAGRLRREVHAVPELLRFAGGHGDAGGPRGGPSAEGRATQPQLEERLFLAVAQLQCLVVNHPEAKRACAEPPFDKAVATLFALPAYRQAVLSRDPNRQTGLLCEVLTLIVNVAVGCPESGAALAVDPSRQKRSVLHTLLAVAMLPGNPHSPVFAADGRTIAFRPTPERSAEAKDSKLNGGVFRLLFQAIAAIVTESEAGMTVLSHSPFLPFLGQAMERWLQRRAAPRVKRLLPSLRLLAAVALHERGQAAILQTPPLLGLALQCAALHAPPHDPRAADVPELRQAALLLVRNLSCFAPAKVQVTNERSLDTLACLMRTLREGDEKERCLAAEALLALVHNSAKARAVIKQQTMWHTELVDVFEHLPPSGQRDMASCPSAADRVHHSLQTVLGMLS